MKHLGGKPILSPRDFTIGAIQRMASRRRFDRCAVRRLLVDRAGLSDAKAMQLADIWFAWVLR